MKKVISRILILTTILLVFGCATQVGKATYPKATEGFVPKKIYAASFDPAWNSIGQALEENRIVIASSDKASGRVTTDYIAGPSELYAVGLGGGTVYRYKYNISARAEGEKTKITIFCTLEYSYSNSDVAKPFVDYGKENPQLVTSLENWLYEQIEKKL